VLFKLDENLPSSLVSVFESADHDAVSAVAQDLQGASDTTLAEVCRREGRVLVTLDAGFADIRAYPPAEYSGIVVLRLEHQDVPYIRATIGRVLRMMVDHPLDRILWIVEDDRVRFRR
jgi:predicted nuclease of predicted toxin-antitoxin system